MDGSGAGFVSSGSCGVDIPESSACNYKVQVYYQGIRNLDAFALFGEEVEQRDEMWFLFHGGDSVIFCDMDVGGGAVFPAEDDAPLLVDADAPESLEIARE